MNSEQKEATDSNHTSGAGKAELVLFDYGQVLSTPPDPQAWSRMQAVARLSGDALHEAYWALRDDYDRGILTGTEYWNALARHAGTAFDEAQVNALLGLDADLWAQPNPPMLGWAQSLQRARIRTAILSNIGDAMAERLTERLEWLRRFERCIWSYELGLAKPDKAIFLRAAELLGLKAQRILFIDDKNENVIAAQSAGMQAIRYTKQAEFEQTLRERGFASLWAIGTKGNDTTADEATLAL